MYVLQLVFSDIAVHMQFVNVDLGTIPESLLQSWLKSKCSPHQPLFVSP